MGHLSIAGSKMSKSLKNFQTIQDALATTYTARNMRIVFLMGRWNDGVEISPDMRKQADSWETTLDVCYPFPPLVQSFGVNNLELLYKCQGEARRG